MASDSSIYSLYWSVTFKSGVKLSNWDDALEITFTFENESWTGNLYLKNDWDFLYVGLLTESQVILSSDYRVEVFLYFDSNNDGVLAEDVKKIGLNSISKLSIEKSDYFVTSDGTMVLDQENIEFTAESGSISLGQGTRDLVEVKIPLTSGSFLEDFQIYVPEEASLGFGLMIARYDVNKSLVNAWGWNVDIQDPLNASSYATLYLAGPADVKIPAYQQTIPGGESGGPELGDFTEAAAGWSGAASGWDFLSGVIAMIFLVTLGLVSRNRARFNRNRKK